MRNAQDVKFQSTVHTSLREVAVGALIAGLLILNSCGAPVSEPVAKTEARPNAPIVGEADWVERLRFWLRVGYSNGPHGSAFAAISPELLRSPSLYTTFAAVGIHEQFDLPLDGTEAIAAWVRGLELDDGAFDDGTLSLPLFIETYWAVRTLERLGGDLNSLQETRAFLLGLQGEDGFFRPDEDIGGDELEQALIASDYTAEALLLLGEPRGSEALRRCTAAVAQRLVSLLADGETPNPGSSGQYIIGAIHTLAEIDPSALSAEARLYLDAALRDVGSLAADPGSLSQVIMLLEARRMLGDPVSVDEEPIRSYVAEGIIPILEGVEKGALFDPMILYQAARLMAARGIAPGDRDAILEALDRYRIAEGWITAVIPMPDAWATFYALGLIETVGGVAFQPDSVRDYLLGQLAPQDGRVELGNVYAAALGLKQLGIPVDRFTQAQGRALSGERLWSEPGVLRNSEALYWLALVYAELEWELPPDLRTALAKRRGELTNAQLDLSVGEIDQLLALENALEDRFLSDEEVTDQLMRLWVSPGGFKASVKAATPDLHSTYLAISSLARLGNIEALPRDAALEYLEACRTDYGFSYVVWDEEGFSTGAGSVQPDLRSTYEGMRILQMLAISSE
jgi:hypothetical protein